MQAIVVRHGGDVLRFPVPRREATVGSGRTCDLRLPYPDVSRLHAYLAPGPEGLVLRDANSKNGLRFRGRRLTEVLLEPGAAVTLGEASMSLEEWPSADLDVAVLLEFPPSRAEEEGGESDYWEALEDRAVSARGSRDAALSMPDGMVLPESASMRTLLDHVAKTVRSRLDVLILGETGTGKELLARTVHLSGPSPHGPFVAINCAAIPAELLEAELFGIHARVATGVDARPGRLSQAEGGTLFLDEIGELPGALQAKLLRFLEEREIHPLGAARPRKIDVRVVSASNRDLPQEVAAGRFRADLFYRLRGLLYHVPPLRDRRADIPILTKAFAQRAALEYARCVRGISRGALELVARHGWPGNVRELASEVERAVLLVPDGAVLETEHLAPVKWAVERKPSAAGPSGVTPASGRKILEAVDLDRASGRDVRAPQPTLQEKLDAVERILVEQALTEAGGNKTHAAALLGVTRSGLLIKLSRLFGGGAPRRRGSRKGDGPSGSR